MPADAPSGWTGPTELTTSDFLAHWGVRVRDFDSVARIRADLAARGLTTDPWFADVSANTVIRVIPVDGPPEAQQPADTGDMGEAATDEVPAAWAEAFLVGDLPSASRTVERVRPDDSINLARTLMQRSNYSQLAVLADERTLLGAVTWSSLANPKTPGLPTTLAEAIEPTETVHLSDNLFDRFTLIRDNDFVFVRDDGLRICGIVTAADLATQFDELARPYFVVREIEHRLRVALDRCFTLDQIRIVKQDATSVRDLMFGQYLQLLSPAERWKCLGWAIDRKLFLEDLDEVRRARNQVAHFKPISPTERLCLVRFLDWLRALTPRL